MTSYSSFSEEEKFGLFTSGLICGLLLLFAVLYQIKVKELSRTAFIEVEFGEFRTGTLAAQAKEQQEEVATRQNPSKVETEVQKPIETPQVEVKKKASDEVVKDVVLPEQKEELVAEVIKTPDTQKIDPNKRDDKAAKEEIAITPKTARDEKDKEGAKESGDVKGLTGKTNVAAGTGSDADKSAPFKLEWEGDIERAPLVQPLPNYSSDVEAVITARFEVKPDGSVGRITLLRKMNPELEDEIRRTLRSWRFSRLPSGVPQTAQYGTITFRFVLN